MASESRADAFGSCVRGISGLFRWEKGFPTAGEWHEWCARRMDRSSEERHWSRVRDVLRRGAEWSGEGSASGSPGGSVEALGCLYQRLLKGCSEQRYRWDDDGEARSLVAHTYCSCLSPSVPKDVEGRPREVRIGDAVRRERKENQDFDDALDALLQQLKGAASATEAEDAVLRSLTWNEIRSALEATVDERLKGVLRKHWDVLSDCVEHPLDAWALVVSGRHQTGLPCSGERQHSTVAEVLEESCCGSSNARQQHNSRLRKTLEEEIRGMLSDVLE